MRALFVIIFQSIAKYFDKIDLRFVVLAVNLLFGGRSLRAHVIPKRLMQTCNGFCAAIKQYFAYFSVYPFGEMRNTGTGSFC